MPLGFLLFGAALVALIVAGSQSPSNAQTAPGTAGGNFPPAGGGGTVVGDVTYGDLQALETNPAQVAAWAALVKMESNGTIRDTNPSSGAYGIAQGITGPGWYAQHGGSPDSVMGQLTAMRNYVHQRYGDFVTALHFHLAHNWY